jgi:type IV pilus assembly protein PilC
VTGLSLLQRAQAYRQLHSLLHAGIPLALSAAHMAENAPVQLRPLFREASERAQRGEPLSAMLTAYPTLFPPWEISMVRAGEASGALPELLSELAAALEDEAAMRARVRASTRMLWVTTSIFVLVAMFVGAVRPWAGVRVDLEAVVVQTLTQFTLLLGAFFMFLRGWGVWMRTPRGTRVGALLAPWVPLLGPIWRALTCIRFARVLGLLWEAGLAPADALETAGTATGNPLLCARIGQHQEQLRNGVLLSEVLRATGPFPAEGLALVRTGETSGTLPQALAKVAEYMQGALEARARALPLQVQVVMYLVLGPAVGYFIITFWMRLYSSLGL